MSAYDELTAQRREPEMLGKIAGRLGRGRETVMPRSAAEQRADEIAALENVLHAGRTEPRIGDWLETASPHVRVAEA